VKCSGEIIRSSDVGQVSHTHPRFLKSCSSFGLLTHSAWQHPGQGGETEGSTGPTPARCGTYEAPVAVQPARKASDRRISMPGRGQQCRRVFMYMCLSQIDVGNIASKNSAHDNGPVTDDQPGKFISLLTWHGPSRTRALANQSSRADHGQPRFTMVRASGRRHHLFAP